MKKNIFLFLSLVACLQSIAQNNERFVVKQGMQPKAVFKFKDIYMYPSFTQGKVNFKEGTSVSAKLNYNRFTGEMDFIQGKDTLALANAEMIKNILIENDVFFYQGEVGF